MKGRASCAKPALMRACVVVFPGINADAELVHTLRDICGAPTTVVWHTETTLPAGRRSRRHPRRILATATTSEPAPSPR